MTTPAWEASQAPAQRPYPGVIPPPPPFPPGDPRLGVAQAGYPTPAWMQLTITQQPTWPQVQLRPAPRRGPVVAGLVGVAGVLAVILGVAWAVSSYYGTSATAGGPGVIVVHPGNGAPATVTQPPLSNLPQPPAAPTAGLDFGTAPALSAVLPQIEQFVEESRGHRFQRQVTVTPLADKAFLAQLAKGSSSGAAASAAIDGEDATLEALHLLPQHTDLAATLAAQRDQAVGGLYDPVSKQLFIRGTTLNPLGQVIVAHELTHALDDQYFDLRHLQEAAANSDQDQAIRSLIEGDARSVENRFRAALMPAERNRADAEQKAEFGAAGRATKPPIFLELDSAFPYEVGAMFVDYLRAHGGTPTLDAAFTLPPTSTLQILDPQGAFLHRVDPVLYNDPGAPPREQGKGVAQDRLGAFGLAAVLAEKAPSDLLRETAVVTGWNGDRYVTTRNGSKTCVRDTISTRDAAGADSLYSALASWAARHPGASVTRAAPPGTLLLRSCVG
jgi:hypothetical protein